MPFVLAVLAEIRAGATLQHEPFAAVLGVLAGATSYQKIITFIAVQRLNTAFGAGFRRAPAVNTVCSWRSSGTISKPPSAAMRKS